MVHRLVLSTAKYPNHGDNTIGRGCINNSTRYNLPGMQSVQTGVDDAEKQLLSYVEHVAMIQTWLNLILRFSQCFQYSYRGTVHVATQE